MNLTDFIVAMVYPRWMIFPFLLFIHLSHLTLTNAQGEFWARNCINTANYTQNSPYRQSLDDALFSLTGTNNGYGFYNYSSGQENSDSAKAIALCRGDTAPDDCRRCVDDATRRLRQVCPDQKDGVGWYDVCFLRYSNSSILGNLDQEVGFTLSNVNNVTGNAEQFNQAVGSLLGRLRGETAAGDSLRKYAAGTWNYTNGSGNSTIYGIMQCTPDLPESLCDACLQRAAQQIPLCCDSKIGGRVYLANCVLRYEIDRFYNETWFPSPPPPPPPPPLPLPPSPPPGNKGNVNVAAIVAPIVAAIAVTGIVLFLVCFSLHRRRKRKGQLDTEEEPLSDGEDINHQMDEDNSGEMIYYSLSIIQVATNNFSASNKLGEGGFGPVYKGVLQDGKEIAVKRLSRNSGQGLEEFKTEVRLIIKLQHKNLVRLLGCCIKGDEKLLVYEYMVNKSLDAFLFDPTACKELDWPIRANIVGGIAKGLRYLHEDSRLKIIHRDMKASNVLLDEEMNPKISDFGTARIFGGTQMEANTNRIVGTYGYMAPEYAMEGLFSTKSDVYSFGVLLLEIVSGKKNSGFHNQNQMQNLLSYAWSLWKDGKGENFIDENLIDDCAVKEALRWINIALLCVQEDPMARPTMSSVVFMLEGEWGSLPQPLEPPFSVGRFALSDISLTTGSQTQTQTVSSTSAPSSASASGYTTTITTNL